MSDESQLQVRPKDGDSSLILSSARSSLVARGRRDAVLLAVSCSKCGEHKELVLAGCVCASCSDALDRQWAGSAATDWVLVAFRGPEPPNIERLDSRYYTLQCVGEVLDDGGISREELESLISTDTSKWPLLYVYTETTYEQMKFHWAICNPPDSLCIGPMTVDEFAKEDGDECVHSNPWPHGRNPIRDAVPYVRPATRDECVKKIMNELKQALRERKEELSETHRLAEEGDADAQCNLGYAYEHGQGVTQDYVVAVRWYRRAAEQGHAEAQFQLGLMYGSGVGVVADFAEAERWYRKAADQGHAEAQCNLAFYYCGRDEPQDHAEAVPFVAQLR